MKKIDNVIIEASSHGLDQKRLHHINFKVRSLQTLVKTI